jgi:hypothetical protein
MKKQIALVLAGTAASIAGGLRLVQELVDRGNKDGADLATSDAPGPAGHSGSSATATSTPSARKKAPESASKAELYEIATKLDIGGRSKMSKAELAEAINNA